MFNEGVNKWFLQKGNKLRKTEHPTDLKDDLPYIEKVKLETEHNK